MIAIRGLPSWWNVFRSVGSTPKASDVDVQAERFEVRVDVACTPARRVESVLVVRAGPCASPQDAFVNRRDPPRHYVRALKLRDEPSIPEHADPLADIRLKIRIGRRRHE